METTRRLLTNVGGDAKEIELASMSQNETTAASPSAPRGTMIANVVERVSRNAER